MSSPLVATQSWELLMEYYGIPANGRNTTVGSCLVFLPVDQKRVQDVVASQGPIPYPAICFAAYHGIMIKCCLSHLSD